MATATSRYYSEDGRATKRQKTDGMATGYEDPHKTLPSVVVHVRGLMDGVTEADLVEALQEFGAISCLHFTQLALQPFTVLAFLAWYWPAWYLVMDRSHQG
ncbi:hypothetical protein AMECASPLE_036190 [Ameca splendens]|uniref:RRM domain-containing protein n=1 Tax=Ameca splendens TaxID=208324 RepID=A0ABV0YUN9_9TELE